MRAFNPKLRNRWNRGFSAIADRKIAAAIVERVDVIK